MAIYINTKIDSTAMNINRNKDHFIILDGTTSFKDIILNTYAISDKTIRSKLDQKLIEL